MRDRNKPCFRECRVVYVQRKYLRGEGDLGSIEQQRRHDLSNLLFIYYL